MMRRLPTRMFADPNTAPGSSYGPHRPWLEVGGSTYDVMDQSEFAVEKAGDDVMEGVFIGILNP